MAFLTSQRGSGTPNVAHAFQKADQTAIAIKKSAVDVRTKTQAGTVTAYELIEGLLGTLARGKPILMDAAGVGGIGAYAGEQYADVPGYAVGPEFTAMMDQINTTITFLEANYPKDADGNLKRYSFVGDGSGLLTSYASFSVPQRNAIVSRLDALIASID